MRSHGHRARAEACGAISRIRQWIPSSPVAPANKRVVFNFSNGCPEPVLANIRYKPAEKRSSRTSKLYRVLCKDQRPVRPAEIAFFLNFHMSRACLGEIIIENGNGSKTCVFRTTAARRSSRCRLLTTGCSSSRASLRFGTQPRRFAACRNVSRLFSNYFLPRLCLS